MHKILTALWIVGLMYGSVAIIGLIFGFILGNIGLMIIAAIAGGVARVQETPFLYKAGGLIALILVSPIKFVLYGRFGMQSLFLTIFWITLGFIFFDWIVKKVMLMDKNSISFKRTA